MSVFVGLVAVMTFAIGTWGVRNLDELVPPVLSEDEQRKRTRVYRRGARVLQITAVLFAASAVATLFVHAPPR
jgi:hypothetical protein